MGILSFFAQTLNFYLKTKIKTPWTCKLLNFVVCMTENILNNKENNKKFKKLLYFKNNYDSWKMPLFYNLIVFPLYTLGKTYFLNFYPFLTSFRLLTTASRNFWFFYQLVLDPNFAPWKQQVTAFVNIVATMH